MWRAVKLYIYIFSFVFLVCGNVYSNEKRFGAGFILGYPSGLTGKYYINKGSAIDFGVGVMGDPYIYGDYLKHYYDVFNVKNFPIYFGIGAGIHFYERDGGKKGDDENETRLEARIPIGIEFLLSKVPLGFFLEIAPALRIAPDIEFDFRFGIGARYYF